MVVVSILTVMVTVNAQSDKTLVPEAKGADVVRAVISKIEASSHFINFDPAPTSSSFMRAMAYVETRDGTTDDPNRGGIWNVAKDLFRRTQTDADGMLEIIIMQLNQTHHQNYIGPVDWKNLTYNNLSTPLYSGLAVRLLIQLSTVPLPVPAQHSMYWVDTFNKTGMQIQRQWDFGKHILSMEEGKRLF